MQEQCWSGILSSTTFVGKDQYSVSHYSAIIVTEILLLNYVQDIPSLFHFSSSMITLLESVPVNNFLYGPHTLEHVLLVSFD